MNEHLTPTTSALQPPTITIQATRGWGQLGLRELWEYRDLLWFHVLREIKGRYRQMALGPLWIILNPFINMVLFTFIFGKVAKLPSEGIPYPIFTYTAMLPWIYFSSSAQNAMGSLVTSMGIISKIYFPRLIMPLSATIAGLVDFAISFLFLIGLMVWFGFPPGWRMLLLPLFLLMAAALGLGIGLWTAALTVRFRDLKLLAASGVRVFMYLTPVAYSATIIAENYPQWMWLYKLNPMYHVIEGFRWCLLRSGEGPELDMLVPVGLTALLLVSGAYVFRRTERTIVDLL